MVRQRVRGNRPLRFRQTKSRHRARRARQSSSLRGQKVQQASTAALKRAKAHQEARLFKSLFGGGGQSASEEESNDVDSATEIDEFADERHKATTAARARTEPNSLRRTFPSPTSTSTSTHPPTLNAHITSVSMYSHLLSHPVPSIPRRSTGARALRPPRPLGEPNDTFNRHRRHIRARARSTVSRVRRSLSRDMTRDFLVPDSFAISASTTTTTTTRRAASSRDG